MCTDALWVTDFAGSTLRRPWCVNREIEDMPDTTLPPGPRWAQVVPAETPSLRGLTTLAVTVVIVAALYFGRAVLVPITLAILLSFVLAPLADLIRRTRIGRAPAVILSVLIALGVIAALGARSIRSRADRLGNAVRINRFL